MPGRFLPPDHAQGDESTVGGYAAVHGRPAALEGPDGVAYSVEIMVDVTEYPASASAHAAYLLFVRWSRIGQSAPDGHVETEYLVHAHSTAEARDALASLPLIEAQRHLDELVWRQRGDFPPPARERRWWDVMREEDD